MRRNVAMLTALSIVTPAFAFAHHSHPFFYDECKSVTLEGRVDSVVFKDPHSIIVLKLDDGTAYTVDWAGLRALTNSRVLDPAMEALVYGARIVVTGNRIRTSAEVRQRFADFKGELNPNTVDPMSIRRADDSFRWAVPPRTTPLNCG